MMKWLRFICVLLACRQAAAASADIPANRLQHPEWTFSIRGKELEAQYLHQLIDDAKVRGVAPDPTWIERLSQIDPALHRGESLPQSTAVAPEPGPFF